MAQSWDDLILIANALGFHRVGVVALDAHSREADSPSWASVMEQYRAWLARGHAGEMRYLAEHADLRAHPERLLFDPSDRLSAIVVTMDYLPEPTTWQHAHWQSVADPTRAVISHYAHGRDYHKVLRSRLVALSEQLADGSPYQFRACVDSAPVLEVELARRCGLGWRGKHTLLLNREQGSMFFLGVLLTDMPLAPQRFSGSVPESNQGHCGSCTQCLDICPTQAFVGPYALDARRCISYLTIEHKGSIPEALRSLIGNRVYGCDDCQAICPWNQFANAASAPDFEVRHGLDRARLIACFSWTQEEFERRHQGSAILRIGYVQWRRNLAVAMGNALSSPSCSATDREAILNVLSRCRDDESELVREHVQWALSRV